MKNNKLNAENTCLSISCLLHIDYMYIRMVNTNFTVKLDCINQYT